MPKVLQYIIGIPILIIICIIICSFIANLIFKHKVNREVEELLSNCKEKQIVQQSDLQGLPSPVQKWMTAAGVIGKERIQSVRMKQQGFMRTRINQPWMPFSAQQYVYVEEPGFIWSVKAHAAPFISIVGRDMYYKGKGNMLIKLLGLVTVANASGKEVNQGSMLRYMAETMWYPSAALSSYIQWETIDDNSAKATMRCKGVEASGVFHFNDRGEPVNFTARRYRETDGSYELSTWSADVADYKEFEGIRIPSTGTITWKLPNGDFTWYRLQVIDAAFNTL